MFDRIAPRYDLLNRLLSAGIDRRWRKRAATTLALKAGGRVLDLCTGTADLLLETLRRDAAATGVGLDLSTEMLRRGAAKLKGAGLAGRAAILSGDAERLPLASSRFDGALIAFGIRNVGSPETALQELHRVLKPGARLVVLEFSNPTGLLGVLYRLYFRNVLPRIGGFVSGDASAYTYLPASVERFKTPQAFASAMEQAGFSDVQYEPLTGGIAYLHRGDKRA